MMLCWIHEGRPYKKLMPVVAQHREILDNFLQNFWDYYHQLLAYKQKPSAEERTRLETEFDILFATRTGFMSLAETTKKLGVSFSAYLRDRITGTHSIPPLAELIEKAAKELNLGKPWAVTLLTPGF